MTGIGLIGQHPNASNEDFSNRLDNVLHRIDDASNTKPITLDEWLQHILYFKRIEIDLRNKAPEVGKIVIYIDQIKKRPNFYLAPQLNQNFTGQFPSLDYELIYLIHHLSGNEVEFDSTKMYKPRLKGPEFWRESRGDSDWGKYRNNVHPILREVVSQVISLFSEEERVSILDLFCAEGVFVLGHGDNYGLLGEMHDQHPERDITYDLMDIEESLVKSAQNRLRKLSKYGIGNTVNIHEIDLTNTNSFIRLDNKPKIVIASGAMNHSVISQEDAFNQYYFIFDELPPAGYLIATGITPCYCNATILRQIGFSEILNMTHPSNASTVIYTERKSVMVPTQVYVARKPDKDN